MIIFYLIIKIINVIESVAKRDRHPREEEKERAEAKEKKKAQTPRVALETSI